VPFESSVRVLRQVLFFVLRHRAFFDDPPMFSPPNTTFEPFVFLIGLFAFVEKYSFFGRLSPLPLSFELFCPFLFPPVLGSFYFKLFRFFFFLKKFPSPPSSPSSIITFFF